MLGAGAAIVIVLVLAGCGGDDSGNAEPTQGPLGQSTPSVAGPFFGVCGSVTDDEVLKAVALPQLPVVTRNSVGCVWETGGIFGPSVSFSWYRGSPIGREAAGSGLIGRPPEKIEIDGRPGFQGSSGAELCEIGVQYGDDFYHWSVTYAGTPPTADVCGVARSLAELTASRAK